METFRTWRHRLSAIVIVAMLVHTFAPALHARAQRIHGPAEWGEVCTSSAAAVSAGERALALKGSKSPSAFGDHHCPSCLTHFSAAPTTVPNLAATTYGDVRLIAAEQLAPDRVTDWSALRSRGPPSLA